MSRCFIRTLYSISYKKNFTLFLLIMRSKKLSPATLLLFFIVSAVLIIMGIIWVQNIRAEFGYNTSWSVEISFNANTEWLTYAPGIFHDITNKSILIQSWSLTGYVVIQIKPVSLKQRNKITISWTNLTSDNVFVQAFNCSWNDDRPGEDWIPISLHDYLPYNIHGILLTWITNTNLSNEALTPGQKIAWCLLLSIHLSRDTVESPSPEISLINIFWTLNPLISMNFEGWWY